MMTSKQVISRREKIEERIAGLENQLKTLQSECSHHNLRYRKDGTSGGYDYDGSYWIDWFCPDCDKRWNTDQSSKEINKYPRARKIDRWTDEKNYNNFYKF